MNKKGQLDFDDISIVGVLGGLIGAGIGIIIAKQTGATVPFRIIAGAICAIVCYFVASKIIEE